MSLGDPDPKDKETPGADHTQRFVALLRLAAEADFCRLPALVALQNRIVDERFREPGYRQRQNYVGESVDWTGERVHYLDMTSQTEALFRFIAATIDSELAEELRFLQRYDTARSAIQKIVDMPDRLIDLFIRVCVQNQGTISRGKRQSQFSMLTDSGTGQMEEAVRTAYELGTGTTGG